MIQNVLVAGSAAVTLVATAANGASANKQTNGPQNGSGTNSVSNGHAKDPESLRIGIVLSGGQAPGNECDSIALSYFIVEHLAIKKSAFRFLFVAGGHNVIGGLLDYLLERRLGSQLIGFKNGPGGILTKSCMDITDTIMVRTPQVFNRHAHRRDCPFNRLCNHLGVCCFCNWKYSRVPAQMCTSGIFKNCSPYRRSFATRVAST